MNAISPTSLLPQAGTLGPESEIAFAKGDAWRKAMEKEQTEQLRRAKSVPLARENQAPRQGLEKDGRFPLQPRTKEPTNALPRDTKLEQFAAGSSSPAGAAAVRSQNAPAAESALRPAWIAAELSRSYAATEFAAAEPARLISLLAAEFKQKWPLKNVHLGISEDGVTVWIRDGELSADPKLAQGLIERIKDALRQDGKELAGLIINGKTIL